MAYHPSNPLIAQSDKTVLLEVNNPLYEQARDALARFAELEKEALRFEGADEAHRAIDTRSRCTRCAILLPVPRS